jgi:hypothetical protein
LLETPESIVSHSGKTTMIGQSAGKSYAYLLGVYLGDGCVTHSSVGQPVFRLNTIDADFALAVRSALVGLTDRPVWVGCHAVPRSTKPNHALRCGDPEICRVLVEDTRSKAEIPAYVFAWPRRNRLAFIAGLMDSEGFVAANRSNPTNRRFYMGYKSCDAWVPDFVRLLEKTGIRIGRISVEQPLKPGYKTPMRFAIKMQSWIDAGGYFNISRKQARVEEWASAGAYERRAANPRRLTSETTRQTGSIAG